MLRRGVVRALRLASGRVRVRSLIAGLLFVLLVICLVLPYPLGMRAETVYRDYFANLRQAGRDARVTSYKRGWFSSDSTAEIPYLGGRLLVKSHFTHGPFVLSGPGASLRPVAAAVLSTIDFASSASNTFKVSSAAPHLITIHGVVHLGGTADMSAILAPFTYSEATTGQTFKLGSGRWTSRIAGIHAQSHYTLDRVEFSSRQGTSRIGGFSADYEGVRDPSGIWLGAAACSMSDAEIQGSAKLPDGKAMQMDWRAHGLRVYAKMWREGAMLDADEEVSIARTDVAGGQPVSIVVDVRAGNLDPMTIGGWLKNLAPIYRGGRSIEAINREFFAKSLALLRSLAKNSPRFATTLKVKGSFGTVTADANGGLKRAMATDPDLAKPNASVSPWKLIRERYLYGSGEIKLPASFRSLAPAGSPQGDWLSKGYVTQEGDNLVSRFKYDAGGLSLNGHPIF
jgi:uncharacterized protein YdgA (DUF945 family)